MSGIDRAIVLDRRHSAKHLPNTPPVQRLLRRGRAAHVFNNEATMERVAQAIIERGEFTGLIRGYERYGLYFVGNCSGVDEGTRISIVAYQVS